MFDAVVNLLRPIITGIENYVVVKYKREEDHVE